MSRSNDAQFLNQRAKTADAAGAAGIADVAITRRGFVVGAALAGAALMFGLPEGVSPFGVQKAHAAVLSSGELDNYNIRLRPKGFLRTIGVHNDGSVKGDVCWLWHQSTSSKHSLSWKGNVGGYSIRTLSNFEEDKFASNSIWSVDDDSKDEGKAIHVWGDDFDDKKSRAFTFERLSDGCFYIKNVNSGLYVTLETPSADKNENKLVQSSSPMEWEIEFVGKGVGGTWQVDSSFYASYTTHWLGAYWMKCIPDSRTLDAISIPGTHDSGTCSVDNDTSPQTSLAKCQQDYIPTQLNEGIRYFDIRLGEGSDPGVNHGGMYLKKKDGGGLQLSDVIGYFRDFLAAQPTEAIIMLASNSDGDDANITSALAKHIKENPNLFYGSSRVPAMSEVRGKIVLLRRFTPTGADANTYKYGLDLYGWDDKVAANESATDKGVCCIFSYKDTESASATDPATKDAQGNDLATRHYYTTVYAQDHYCDDPDDKIAWVDTALEDVATDNMRMGYDVDGETVYEHRWNINYTSSSKFFDIHTNPYYAAQTVNAHLYTNSYINYNGEWENTDCNKFVGIVVSDFTDASLAYSIYRRNYSRADDPMVFYLPNSVEMTYGDDLAAATLVGGKTFGDGYFKLVSESDADLLDVAHSGQEFQIVYVDVDANGNETVTNVAGRVPFTINPRPVTLNWEKLRGLVASADARGALRDALENVVAGDDCSAALEFYEDKGGVAGGVITDPSNLGEGTYWARATGLVGDHAANYTLADTDPVSFTVAAAAGGAAAGGGTDGADSSDGSGGADKSGSGNLAQTGDDTNVAPLVGVAAAAAAVAVGAGIAAHRAEDAL